MNGYRTFIVQIVLPESVLEGDEFWEEVQQNDPSGIKTLKDLFVDLLEQSNLTNPEDEESFVQVTSFPSNCCA